MTASPPFFSVVMPVHDPDPRWLRRAIESVCSQTEPGWELCIADDGSRRPEVAELLSQAARAARVKLVRSREAEGIAAASNRALRLAQGAWVALLDHDDELHPRALEMVRYGIRLAPDADFVYTDEDKLLPGGEPGFTYRKPDWSPEVLLSHMYIGHLMVIRRSLVEQLGGFRDGFDGSQDHDLALRATAAARRVVHVPEVLYHWRQAEGSTAASAAAKPHAFAAGRRALADHVARIGLEATVEDSGHPGRHRVRRRVTGSPLVSVIVPTAGGNRRVEGRDTRLVELCASRLAANTAYPAWEVLCVADSAAPADLRPALAGILGDRLRWIQFSGRFDFSAKINLGAAAARGDHLLLLNDDVLATDPEWMAAMLAYSQVPGIGVVGARLLYPDSRLQHAGVACREGAPVHAYMGRPRDEPGHFGCLLSDMNVAAVTAACLMTRREVFFAAGGLSRELPVNYNDVDYCFKVRRLGYRVVVPAGIELIHLESATRRPGATDAELGRLRRRWGLELSEERYFNPFDI